MAFKHLRLQQCTKCLRKRRLTGKIEYTDAIEQNANISGRWTLLGNKYKECSHEWIIIKNKKEIKEEEDGVV